VVVALRDGVGHGVGHGAGHGAEKIEIFFHKIYKATMTQIPPRIKLRRSWTNNKMHSLVHSRTVDIGINLLRNVIFTCNPRSVTEIINEADERAHLRGFTNPTGSQPHHSTIAVHNGSVMERRVYFNSWKIEWIPI
jgi:hypothetical protein